MWSLRNLKAGRGNSSFWQLHISFYIDNVTQQSKDGRPEASESTLTNQILNVSWAPVISQLIVRKMIRFRCTLFDSLYIFVIAVKVNNNSHLCNVTEDVWAYWLLIICDCVFFCLLWTIALEILLMIGLLSELRRRRAVTGYSGKKTFSPKQMPWEPSKIKDFHELWEG
jgi:hypothetical protein